MWLSIVRLESSVAPRILTLSESGIAVPATFKGIEPGMEETKTSRTFYTTNSDKFIFINDKTLGFIGCRLLYSVDR